MSRLYGGARHCARCRIEISCTDLVMKARHCIFHIDCFRCATCDSSLRKGKLPFFLCSSKRSLCRNWLAFAQKLCFTGHQLSTNFFDKYGAKNMLYCCQYAVLLLGDLFGMFEDVLYCRLHFEMMTSYGSGDPLEMCPPLHSPNGTVHTLILEAFFNLFFSCLFR